jgi:hypothetical protein
MIRQILEYLESITSEEVLELLTVFYESIPNRLTYLDGQSKWLQNSSFDAVHSENSYSVLTLHNGTVAEGEDDVLAIGYRTSGVFLYAAVTRGGNLSFREIDATPLLSLIRKHKLNKINN